MAKSKGRFLAELLGSDGKVEKAKSDAGIYAGANVTIAADGTLQLQLYHLLVVLLREQ